MSVTTVTGVTVTDDMTPMSLHGVSRVIGRPEIPNRVVRPQFGTPPRLRANGAIVAFLGFACRQAVRCALDEADCANVLGLISLSCGPSTQRSERALAHA
jgi:hypothetical protein